MDAVSLIVAALEVRAASAAPEAHARFWDAVRGLFTGRPEGELMLARYLTAPDQWRAPLAAWLLTNGAAADARLVAAARTLLELTDPAGWRAGEYRATVTDARRVPAGDHNAQSNTFVSAAGQAVAAGQDVYVSASGGSVAAGVFHGSVVLPPARPEVRGLPVRLPPRPASLAGREELLAEVDARLAGPSRAHGPRLTVLCGLGGAGKTSVAVEYAHRHLAELNVCWQFQAEDAAVLASEFAVLAAQLGAWQVADARDPVASVHAVLASSDGWLLIFDNVPDQSAVERFLPPSGPGQVLITTQSQHWPSGQAVDVPVLDPEVAAEFLVSRTGDPDRVGAYELAVGLGGLPLALEQAAAYMRATGIPMTRYLPLFRERQSDLLARGEAPGHPKPVTSTVAMALARLEGDAPAAAGLLRLLAFLGPEPVPLGLVLARNGPASRPGTEAPGILGQLLDDPVAVGDAVAALRRYSLAAPVGDGLLQVHRLVQAITRAQMTAQEAGQWKEAARTLVDAAVPAEPELPDTWPACAALLPHAQATLDLTSGGIGRLAQYLGHVGDYPGARELYARIADAHRESRDHGPEHPGTLSARAQLARWTGVTGKEADARDQFTSLVPVLEQALGPEHPGTLSARAQRAHWTAKVGDMAGAERQYAGLVPVLERVLGPEHPDTLAARAELAHWGKLTGDPAGIRDQYADLLPILQPLLGPEHPGTLSVRAQLARWTGTAGNEAQARDQYADLVPVLERVLGPEHPDTLSARAQLARWSEGTDPAGTWDRYAGLVPVLERVLGPEHPDTLAARHNFAHWTGETGDPAEARDQFAAVLAAREHVHGTEHPSVLTTRSQLAYWTGRAGDPAGARDQLASLLPVSERVRGPEHPDTLHIRSALARWTAEAQRAASVPRRVFRRGRRRPRP